MSKEADYAYSLNFVCSPDDELRCVGNGRALSDHSSGADIARQHHVDAGSSGLAGTFFGFAYAGGFLVFGPLSDRLGRSRVLLFGLLAAGAATALVGIAGSFAFFLSARALQGASAAAIAVGALALVPEALLPHHRPLGVSAMSLAFLGSAPIAQLVGASLAGGGISTIRYCQVV